MKEQKSNKNVIILIGLIFIVGIIGAAQIGLLPFYYSTGKLAHLNHLGYNYFNGRGVAKDENLAIKYWQEAADHGYANSIFNLGYAHESGRGLPKDYLKAAEYYKIAADAGLPHAQYALGYLYSRGKGVEQDYAKAKELYLLCAEQGDAMCENELGNLYNFGRGVTKDYKVAAEWYTKAASKNNHHSQNNLAHAYFNGNGVEKDIKKAIKLWEEAANNGNESSQLQMGWLYQNGDYVEKDKEKSAAWYEKAALQGNAKGLYSYAYSGKASSATAYFMLMRAALKDDPKSQYVMALYYCPANSNPQNIVHGYAWAKIAEENNYSEAKGLKESLKKKLTPAQLAEAEKLSEQIKDQIENNTY